MNWAHPIVRKWFLERFSTPTEPQELGWPSILAGNTTLISAPTGSGKTLAAFLICIDRLIRKAVTGELADRTEVLYVSPLRALSNDIQANLQVPLREISAMAFSEGLLMPQIRTAVRTGDTLARDRVAMLKRPPHILVTTPESLYILLTAEKSRAILRSVETVIVDEIHAVADDKRGAHLSLSLERLEALTERRPVRIGLSATQKPIEEVAQFLSGTSRPAPVVIDVGHKRELDLSVEVPDSELGPVASHELWDEIYDRIAQLVTEHRSTLVFVNTRKLAERIAHRLIPKLGEEVVAAHHGSLSRKIRFNAERKLKNGELKVLVATASLELGIDIGAVDLVCQIGSARSIAVALQRIGRSGHWRGAIPKGKFFPTTRDELVECAATVRAIRQGDLDRLMIPPAPLDILAQQICAMCAAEPCQEEALFALIRRSYPYRNLTEHEYETILQMLSDGIASSRGRYAAYLHRDQVHKTLRARRGTRLAAITSGGAIPETGLYTVVAEPEGMVVGTLDEDFAVESNQGDILLLGTTSWLIRRVQSSAARVLVEDAHGAPPTVPFWRGEAPARTAELSSHISELREIISRRLAGDRDETRPFVETVEWLQSECGLDRSGAEQIISYIAEGKAVLGAVPTKTRVIAERFFDESGGMQLVIHAPFGARINKAWGLALRKRFCRSFNLELQASATDDGLNISLTEQHSFPLADVFHFLHSNSVERVVTQAALASPLFGTRWRWDAMRSLAVVRFQRGKKIPLQILRMRSEDLLASVFPEAAACQDNVVGDIELPDHPLIRETMQDVLQEAMELEGLKSVLNDMQSGRIECVAVDTPIPSVFSHEILNANPYAYLDDAPLEERRARAVTMRRSLPQTLLEEIGLLDPAAVGEVVQQAIPDIRTADELHDLLLTLVNLPARLSGFAFDPEQMWSSFLEDLVRDGRAGVATVEGREFWFAAERLQSFRSAYPSAQIIRQPSQVDAASVSREDAFSKIICGWMPYCGPVTIQILSGALCISAEQVEQALLRLERSGAVLRGKFLRVAELQWCDRRLLARIHRLTIGALRKQIDPVTSAQFMRWLFCWQHVAPGKQLHGEAGTIEVLQQLQGFEVPAREWEQQILAHRISDYDPAFLDKLCYTGAVGWGRLSSPSATSHRKSIPGSAAPITFFLREDCDWLHQRSTVQSTFTSEAATVVTALREQGASFIPDLVRSTELRKNEVETALWELVTLGIVSADGFDGLRALLAKGKKGIGKNKNTGGRWSLLFPRKHPETEQDPEPFCRMLLDRYGVVFRDMVQRETLIPRWREILIALRKMEDRGIVRGGRFVSGFVGEQFALPLAVDSLRAIRRIEPSGEMVTLSAADPLNLSGIIVPGERVPAVSRTSVMFRDGACVSHHDATPPATISRTSLPYEGRD